MEFSASQIAAIVNGEIIGSSSAIVTDLTKIEEGKEGTLSFYQTRSTKNLSIQPNQVFVL